MIDDEFESHDCLEATLFGRKGVLVIQRYMQVRFTRVGQQPMAVSRDLFDLHAVPANRPCRFAISMAMEASTSSAATIGSKARNVSSFPGISSPLIPTSSSRFPRCLRMQ